MFYAKKIHLLSDSATFSFVKANFRLYIKQGWSFEKSLSTFQPFTYDVSNERYLINEMCIEGFPQRLESRIDQFWHLCQRSWRNCQKLWYSLLREIDQWSYEWKCFSVISCVMPEMVFCIYIWLNQFIPVHFYALASHCIYILSCWKIEAYNVLVKFTFISFTANGGVGWSAQRPPFLVDFQCQGNISRGPWKFQFVFWGLIVKEL